MIAVKSNFKIKHFGEHEHTNFSSKLLMDDTFPEFDQSSTLSPCPLLRLKAEGRKSMQPVRTCFVLARSKNS